MTYYELFEEETGRGEAQAENVRVRTLRKIEQSQARPHMARPLARVLLAAAVVLALVGGAFAAPAILSALTGMQSRQGGKPVVLLDETGLHAKEGYLEITPELSVNADAPVEIETWYVPSLCDGWEKLTLYYTTEAVPTMKNDASFGWMTPEGGYVLLRQTPLGRWASGTVYETVSLGFGNDFTVEQRQYSEITAQWIAVPPSETDDRISQPEELTLLTPARRGCYDPDAPWVNYGVYGMQFVDSDGDEMRLYYRGLQRLYWSDGDYLFSLEVNYDLSDEVLAAIVESMTPVDETAPYVKLEYVEPQLPETFAVSEVLFPTAVPEGWELASDGGAGSDSDRCWVWSYGGRSGLELDQTTDLGLYDVTLLDWLGLTEEYTSYETTVNGRPAKAFESETEACLLWKTDTECFVLQSAGPDRLRAAALEALAASLAPLP